MNFKYLFISAMALTAANAYAVFGDNSVSRAPSKKVQFSDRVGFATYPEELNNNDAGCKLNIEEDLKLEVNSRANFEYPFTKKQFYIYVKSLPHPKLGWVDRSAVEKFNKLPAEIKKHLRKLRKNEIIKLQKGMLSFKDKKGSLYLTAQRKEPIDSGKENKFTNNNSTSSTASVAPSELTIPDAPTTWHTGDWAILAGNNTSQTAEDLMKTTDFRGMSQFNPSKISGASGHTEDSNNMESKIFESVNSTSSTAPVAPSVRSTGTYKVKNNDYISDILEKIWIHTSIHLDLCDLSFNSVCDVAMLISLLDISSLTIVSPDSKDNANELADIFSNNKKTKLDRLKIVVPMSLLTKGSIDLSKEVDMGFLQKKFQGAANIVEIFLDENK